LVCYEKFGPPFAAFYLKSLVYFSKFEPNYFQKFSKSFFTFSWSNPAPGLPPGGLFQLKPPVDAGSGSPFLSASYLFLFFSSPTT